MIHTNDHSATNDISMAKFTKFNIIQQFVQNEITKSIRSIYIRLPFSYFEVALDV